MCARALVRGVLQVGSRRSGSSEVAHSSARHSSGAKQSTAEDHGRRKGKDLTCGPFLSAGVALARFAGLRAGAGVVVADRAREKRAAGEERVLGHAANGPGSGECGCGLGCVSCWARRERVGRATAEGSEGEWAGLGLG